MKKFLRTAVCCLAAILLCSGIIIGCSEYKKSDFAFGKHFKSGTPYTNGYAVVSEDDGEKVIDTDGKVIFSGNYDSIFIASPHLIGVEKAGKFGFMNLDGTTAIELQFYSAAPFSDGFARVTLRHGFGMQFNYTDEQGNLLLDFAVGSNMCTLKNMFGETIEKEISNTTNFQNGVAAVCDAEQNWALIDKNGQLLTDFMYKEMHEFSNMIGKCKDESGAIVFIDTAGKVLFRTDAADCYECISDRIRFRKNGLFGYLDRNGKVCIEAQFSSATDFGNDTPLAVVKDENGQAFVLGKDDKKIEIQQSIENIAPYSDGLAVVKLTDGQYAYADTDGKICEQRFDFADICADGLCPVKIDGKFGYIEKVNLKF